MYINANTRTYTFKTDSNLDTYLYVIDPSSTKLLTSKDYNDDYKSGDYDSKVTKELQAYMPYYIVYSLYSINMSTTERLVLQINKE